MSYYVICILCESPLGSLFHVQRLHLHDSALELGKHECPWPLRRCLCTCADCVTDAVTSRRILPLLEAQIGIFWYNNNRQMVGFAARKAAILSSLNASTYTDRSPKGSVDKPLLPFLARLNRLDEYVSTSCCSGRICVSSDRSGHSMESRWMLCSHDPITLKQLETALQEQEHADEHEHDVVLRFEPVIIAIECVDLSSASRLHQMAVHAGCRESGIQLTTDASRFIVSIRCSVRLEVPLIRRKERLVAADQLHHFVDICNEKLAANQRKIDSLCTGLNAFEQVPSGAPSNSVLVVAPQHAQLVMKALKQHHGWLDTRSGRKVCKRCNSLL